MSRIATVFGATGLQGSSVVQALLKDGTFAVRSVTRNANSDSAKKLKADGTEIVEANLLDYAAVEKAVTGSEVVFAVTNFWDKDNFNPGELTQINPDATPQNSEYLQGKNIVDAAKKMGVKFLVWSSLPSPLDISKALNAKDPKIKVYNTIGHYDVKTQVDKYLETAGIDYSILHTGYFLENLWRFGALQKDEKGLVLKVPNFKVKESAGEVGPVQTFSWITQSLGQSALSLFKNYQTKKSEVCGKVFYPVNAKVPYEEIAKALSESLGKPVRFDPEGTTGSEEMDDMFEYHAVVGVYRDEEIPDPRLVALGVKFATVEEFARDEGVKAKISNLF